MCWGCSARRGTARGEWYGESGVGGMGGSEWRLCIFLLS